MAFDLEVDLQVLETSQTKLLEAGGSTFQSEDGERFLLAEVRVEDTTKHEKFPAPFTAFGSGQPSAVKRPRWPIGSLEVFGAWKRREAPGAVSQARFWKAHFATPERSCSQRQSMGRVLPWRQWKVRLLIPDT